jgi:hypothetical protein
MRSLVGNALKFGIGVQGKGKGELLSLASLGTSQAPLDFLQSYQQGLGYEGSKRT